MHLPSKTLSTSAVLAALLPLTAAISPLTAQCIRFSSRHEAAVSPCGDKVILGNCLASLADFFLQTDVEICYLNAGCGPDEAAAEAIQLLTRCATDEDPESSTFVQELRKRQRRPAATPTDDPATDNTDTAADGPAAGNTDTADSTPTRNTPVRTSAAKTTEAATTKDANTDVETVVVTNPDKATTPVATPSSGNPPPDFCTTTTTVTVNSCTSDAPGGKTQCDRVSAPKATCREGYLCKMDSSGVTTCMEKQDKLTTGGIIVALAFSAAIVVSVALMTFFCCREKSQQKKLKAKMEAAAIAKASGGGKKRNVSDRVPLISAQGGPQDSSYDGHPGYADAQQGPAGPNPFQDQQRY
jgi:hypothetical protein